MLFATIHGIASLVTAGVVDPEQVGAVLTDSIARFPRGARAPP